VFHQKQSQHIDHHLHSRPINHRTQTNIVLHVVISVKEETIYLHFSVSRSVCLPVC